MTDSTPTDEQCIERCVQVMARLDVDPNVQALLRVLPHFYHDMILSGLCYAFMAGALVEKDAAIARLTQRITEIQ